MQKNIFICLLFVFTYANSQEYFPANTEVKTKNNSYQAFTNATIHTTPTNSIQEGILLVKNGRIVAIGKSVSIPANTQVYDLNKMHVYPSFIDLHTNFGIKKKTRSSGGRRSAQYDPSREGYYWNDHILSDHSSFDDYSYSKSKAKEMRKQGFGVVNTHQPNGIHRGTGMVVALNDIQNDNYRILSKASAEHFSFKKSVTSNQSYPSSVMGAMALIRQVYHDADWYSHGNATNRDFALEAVIKNKKLPKIFEADNKLNVVRAAKVSKEMGLNLVIKASGFEYEQLHDVKALNPTLILPLNFPKPYEVTDNYLVKKISLNQMRRWNQAPANPAMIEDSGIQFALTTADLKSPDSFLKNLKKAIDYGLSKTQALAALTTIPAQILGMSKEIGTLQKGAFANFIVTSGEIFDEKTKIYENWVQGQPHVIVNRNIVNIDGKYSLAYQEQDYTVDIKKSTTTISVSFKMDTIALKSKASYKDQWLQMTLFDKEEKEITQFSAKIGKDSLIKGQGTNFKGNSFVWSAKKATSSDTTAKKKKENNAKKPIIATITYPNNGYGFKQPPKKENILFKNATVWTNEAEGILENTDVLVVDGKIAAVGKAIDPGTAMVIDATGKHVTSGIIDEHSHIAASSINEGGQNSSAEVTIEDVIDPNDIDIYRNLSGGVTTIQILHGSANPIGGRSAIIKLKWGNTIAEMLYPNADPFIKFALGENVKQSNWSSYSRFPQSRMGVEQVFEDYFNRAKEYGEKWTTYNSLKEKIKTKTAAPRYDAEMEALWEILKGERFISCHSYVQSEINMLMKVADRHDFKINTFTHILEGYKVADKMKAHGAGGSTFSDWWGYKFEVNDAIPYNGPIMHNAGVTVAYNSDDGEMSRRLNQEAAKAVKYGGISEEEAWKFVTLNPAKLLHIDDKVGSVKTGKVADLVLWNDHPMSIYAIAEKTMIEGALYYDHEKVTDQLAAIASEKRMLMQQMIAEKKGGAKTQAPKWAIKREFHCETLD